MAVLFEKDQLQKILGQPLRSKNQVNALFESDCEILRLDSQYLCVSTDSIGEEIQTGLYRDPESWGWMSVMTSVSDLAASGATPLGLTLAAEWKTGTRLADKKICHRGISAALKKFKTPLLGGDSGHGTGTVLTTTVIGLSKKKPLQRIGVEIDDQLVLIGKKRLGIGPAFGFQYLFSKYRNWVPEKLYRPCPDPWLMSHLRPLAHASIDTSDGVATSLAILADLNQCGFEIEIQESAFHPAALRCCAKLKIHPLTMLMAELGDYQTLLCVPRNNMPALQRLTTDFLVLGKSIRPLKLLLRNQSLKIPLPTDALTGSHKSLSDLRRVLLSLSRHFASTTF